MADESQDSGLLARWLCLLAATRDPRLSKAAVAVLAAVLDRMDKNGVAWPSLGKIAEDAGTGRRNVTTMIKQLVDLGYLKRESGDRTTSNRYRMGSARAAPRVEAAPRQGRDEAAPKVGAQPSLEVGVCGSPELAYRNLPIEPAKEKQKRSRKKDELTFDQWMESVRQDEEKAIPPEDPIFKFRDQAGIPDEFFYLAWRWFCQRFRGNPKKQRDWRAHFRNSIYGDWHRCWRHDNASGQFVLTNVGMQLQNQLDAEEREAA